MSKIKKSESILAMEIMGLNTLDYFITHDEREATHYLAKHMDDLLSLRTERGNEYDCPYYYMMPGKDLIHRAIKHIEEGYKLILAPSLDTKGCIAFGATAITDEGESDVIEFVIGEGKVRELDFHPKKIMIRTTPFLRSSFKVSDDMCDGHAQELNSTYRKIKENVQEYVPCIVEWSYYNYPVGRLQKNDIYWEVRPYR